MPVNPTYPGVYIDELPSAVRTIIGVPTSVTAFVGPASRGPVDQAVHITSFADFQRIFGGISRDSPMSYAVYHYYQNGGSEAEIVRIANGATPAAFDLGNGVKLEARYPGTWGNKLRARVDLDTKDPANTKLFNLIVRDGGSGLEERFGNVEADDGAVRSLKNVLESSRLIALAKDATTAVPEKGDEVTGGQDPFADQPAGKKFYVQADGGGDGTKVTDTEYLGGTDGEVKKKGIHALLNTDIFNLLCLPPSDADTDVGTGTLNAALTLCVKRRAMLIADPPKEWADLAAAVSGIKGFLRGDDGKNAATYFPRIVLPDPERENRPTPFAPSGAVAGVFARTDAQRGVWKAPAGLDASLNGVQRLTVPLTDLECGQLNPLGLNCLRTFPIIGNVVWGARTLKGADAFADQWKYVPVRRLALFIEESLFRGTQWVVFEPNDEPLWSGIRLNVGAFMNNLFRQGAFQGRTPRDAYIVKCDKENNPQNDIDRGIVNILVGFAPLKPAEFVIIHIQQLAGQIQV